MSQRLPLPEGTLLPVLRPADWPHRELARTRALFDKEMPFSDLPVISYGLDNPGRIYIVPDPGYDDEVTADPQRTHQAALAGISAREVRWREDHDDDGDVMGLTFIDEFAAETLLAPRHLWQAQSLLKAKGVLIAAPIRDMIRIQDVFLAGGAQAVASLIAWARFVFEDAGGKGHPRLVSPHVLIAMNGRLSGVATPEE